MRKRKISIPFVRGFGSLVLNFLVFLVFFFCARFETHAFISEKLFLDAILSGKILYHTLGEIFNPFTFTDSITIRSFLVYSMRNVQLLHFILTFYPWRKEKIFFHRKNYFQLKLKKIFGSFFFWKLFDRKYDVY